MPKHSFNVPVGVGSLLTDTGAADPNAKSRVVQDDPNAGSGARNPGPGIQREKPGLGPSPVQAPMVAGDEPEQHTRPRWTAPWHRRVPGSAGSAASIPQRYLPSGATLWGNVIPYVYGSNRVPGYLGALSVKNGYVYAGIVFAHGPQDSIATVKLAGDTTPAGVAVKHHTGDGTALGAGNTGSILNSTNFTDGVTSWGAADDAIWKDLCHIAVSFSDQVDIPSFEFTALLGGHDFADWAGSTAPHTSVLKVAWHIFQSTGWIGDLTSRLDDGVGGSWRTAAAYWDTDPGDGTKMAEFVGAIQHRDPEAAITEVLNHAFAEVAVGEDGTVKVWSQMPPPAIAGTVSASATSTITGSGTAFDTALAVGEYVYFAGYWAAYGVCKVVSIAGATSMVIDTTVTLAAGTVCRRLQHGGIYIRDEDWLRRPTFGGLNKAALADYYRVKFSSPTDGGDDYREAQQGAGTTKRIEKTLPGCAGASQATRHAETWRDIEHQQKFRWQGGIDRSGRAAELDLGDVFLIDFGGRTQVPVMLLSKKSRRFAEWVTVLDKMVLFDGSAYSGSTDTDTTPVVPPTWNDVPDPVTSVGYTWRYYGADDRLSTEHDDVANWDTNTDVTVTANATSGPTGLSVGTADKVVPTSASASIAGPAAVGRAATPIERAYVFLKAVATEGDVEVATSGGSTRDVYVRAWWRWYAASGGDSGGSITVNLPNGADRPDLHVCGAGSYIVGGDWDYAETVTWTAPADVANISRVALQYKTSSGGLWIEHASAPVDAGTLSWGTADTADAGPLPVTWYDWRLVCVGRNPRFVTAFPDPVATNYAGTTTARQSLEGSKYAQLGSSEVVQIGDPAGGTNYLAIDENGIMTRWRTVVVTTTAATYNADADDHTILCDCTSNAITVNLPTAASISGRVYFITKTDSTGNDVTVDPNGAETISGSSTVTITQQWTTLRIVSDGTNWVIQ